MPIATALDGNPIEVGAKFFLRSGYLVAITQCVPDGNKRVILSWQGVGSGRIAKNTAYTFDGEYERSDYEVEDSKDIVALHSYKSNDFNKAIRFLEARAQALQA